MEFKWDEEKSRRNLAKHGVRFDDAVRVFDDPRAISVQDRVENGEERWQTVGRVGVHRILLSESRSARDAKRDIQVSPFALAGSDARYAPTALQEGTEPESRWSSRLQPSHNGSTASGCALHTAYTAARLRRYAAPCAYRGLPTSASLSLAGSGGAHGTACGRNRNHPSHFREESNSTGETNL